ncbi:mpv17-like protein 2 [Folsomia candida]|uniref:mpv17-like protein 2 n=1 Tax=Folsomia candida TaxID=158441 RepID=UPI000B9057CB|nr:mpv17-like protein 2 [Folsomia candida]
MLPTFFRTLFSKHPLTVNTISGAGLFIVGDFIEQKIESWRGVHGKELDTHRLGRIAAVGLLESPPHYYFYKYLDIHYPGKSFKMISKKILLDQVIACPMFSVLFFIPLALLEGKSWGRSCEEFKNKFPYVYLVDWILWPPCQLINFYFVPAHYRVLYVNTFTVLWNVFLSYMKHYDQFE